MAEPKRDRWGRYKLPDPTTGEERGWTRVTTLAEAMQDSYGLTEWKLRTVALGIGMRQDLYDLAAASDADDKKQLTEICEDAMKAAQADSRSKQGTALHKFTQRYDQGQATRAPRRWARDLETYEAGKAAWGIQTAPTMCERITVVPEIEVAGTMDRIVKYQDIPTIFDLKTGTDVIKGGMKMAIQLAIYSRGRVLWDEENARWVKMPVGIDQTRGLIFHLPVGEGTATLYEVDLTVGWEMAQMAYRVREARKRKDYLNQVGETVKVADDGED